MPRQLTLERRHFQFIASVVVKLFDADFPNPTDYALENRKLVAEAFIRALRPTNPAFKPDAFRRACGLDPD